MPSGKPAGVACVQLDGAGRCRLFGQPERPAVCASLQPSVEMCGDGQVHAMHWLAHLETATAPASPSPSPSQEATFDELIENRLLAVHTTAAQR